MTTTIEAIYDGQVIRLENPLALAPNTRVRITIEAVEATPAPVASFLRTARALNVDGPRDWAANLEDYLYGNGDASRD
jgi:predicted DNA-binding antitoxin AbrB/MazE fold protein